jgi:uncharacterized protein YcbK (DUF882 family)
MGDLSPNFSTNEFECSCGCGLRKVDPFLVEILEDIRAHFNAPVRINSGCRCRNHNTEVGGEKYSFHLPDSSGTSRAADIVVESVLPDAVYIYADKQNWGGVGRYTGRTHVDVGPKNRRWDMRGKG